MPSRFLVVSTDGFKLFVYAVGSCVFERALWEREISGQFQWGALDRSWVLGSDPGVCKLQCIDCERPYVQYVTPES